ncbi:hypothetical protein DFA_02075 [Cavenderia fasciculata]|uniref:Uncharacterized protein n=1 Tax=Cavenderia fasciculata TaxID=261658 RepID=F4PYM2_CACFS|nr:uncharacterized protein DFA_02075 [Cavenderia fasciculata]EGG19288.1 hypothetical protein DFA_02075 [Cavenderia fasciculata]|eukprot:XP_004357559.1 hypothetical protein DFA_02075 [Cavenderia fasciculata]
MQKHEVDNINKISNVVVLIIINHVDDNVDLVCDQDALKSPQPHLKKLSIVCKRTATLSFIPPSEKELEITSLKDRVSGYFCLFQILKDLDQTNYQNQMTTLPITLPRSLQEFIWIPTSMASENPSPCTPTLKQKTIIPESVIEFKYVSTFNKKTKVHSIGVDNGYTFPLTLKKLTVQFIYQEGNHDLRIFQLNNQTNVDHLTLVEGDYRVGWFNFQVDNRRLDRQNNNVLIVGKSLYGGIINHSSTN